MRRRVQVLLDDDDYVYLLENAGQHSDSGFLRSLLRRERDNLEKEKKMTSGRREELTKMVEDAVSRIKDPRALVDAIAKGAAEVIAVREATPLGRCGGHPVGCGGEAKVFRDDLSRREYAISRLCQSCQDKVFSTEAEKRRMVEEEEGELDTVDEAFEDTAVACVPTEVTRD